MKLLEPFTLGSKALKNRIVMAPLARSRGDEHRAPKELVGTYYAQRATAGLIITEANHISLQSATRARATAHHSEHQNQAWRKVVGSIHDAGGVVFQQIYHVGRKALLSGMPNGEQPVAPSAIPAFGGIMKEDGLEEFPVPRPLQLHEIPAIVEDHRRAARLAREAGFDGIEILAGNGFLLDQFLRDSTNLRTDAYGGPIENRARLLLEVVDAAIAELGADRIGVRISPHFRADHISDSDPVASFSYVARELDKRRIAYLHLLEGTAHDESGDIPLYKRLVSKSSGGSGPRPGEPFLAPTLRSLFRGALILNSGYDRESAEQVVANGIADAVSFGRLYISNPDLPERFRLNAPLNAPDTSTFYTNGPEGYVDYPFLTELPAVAAQA
ncbi:alkene reductase [Bradyrhizobium sp. SSUT18]|uniref:alkene reductase n=1 Tax=Bradyrhizobium sp. SSUT18 TaxID=3040602 RepID=UPI002446E6AE|nr:alkene reductase [Bradyrhizobium sp. SSUT18]MDH2399954.1 alkene reductase [Bradyrhizobium sp. SSUT18]